jgi:hypothetical protein
VLSFLLGIGGVIAMFWGVGAYFRSIRDDGRPGWMQAGDWGGGRIRASGFARATFICDHIPFGFGEEIHGFIETRNRPALRKGVVLVVYGPGEVDDRVEWADHAFVPSEQFEYRGDVVRIPVLIPLPEKGAPTNRGIGWILHASAGPIFTGLRATFEVPVAESNVFRTRHRDAPDIPRRKFVPAPRKPYTQIAVSTIAATVLVTLAITITDAPAPLRWFFAAISIGMFWTAADWAFGKTSSAVRDGFVIIDRRTVIGNSVRTLPVISIRKVELEAFDNYGMPYWNVRLTLEDGKSVTAARCVSQRSSADELATSIGEAIQSRASSLTT